MYMLMTMDMCWAMEDNDRWQ